MARLDRVEAHLATLNKHIRSFVEDEHTYRVEAEQSYDRAERIVYGTALQRPPSLEWAPLISDIVNGLRSSLDNVIWALSVRQQRPLGNPPPRGKIPGDSPWRDVCFPVVTKESDWPARRGQALRFVNRSLLPLLRDVQPFVTGQQAPEREPLAVAHELWTIDKHRHVPLVSVWAGGEETQIRVVPARPIPGVEFRTSSVAGARVLRLNAKTELARIRCVDRVARLAGLSMAPVPPMGMYLDVEHNVSFQITFKSGIPGYRQDVEDVLSAVHRTTLSLVNDLRSHLS